MREQIEKLIESGAIPALDLNGAIAFFPEECASALNESNKTNRFVGFFEDDITFKDIVWGVIRDTVTGYELCRWSSK